MQKTRLVLNDRFVSAILHNIVDSSKWHDCHLAGPLRSRTVVKSNTDDLSNLAYRVLRPDHDKVIDMIVHATEGDTRAIFNSLWVVLLLLSNLVYADWTVVRRLC